MKLDDKKLLDASYSVLGIFLYYARKLFGLYVKPNKTLGTRIVNKQDIKDARINYKREITYFDVDLSSSGTSGEPTTVFANPMHWISEQAAQYEYFKENGYKFRDKMIIVRGYAPKKGQPFYKHDKLRNFLWLSPFHLNDETIEEIKDILNGRYFLRGYPSSLCLLAQLLKGQPIDQPQAIFTASEMLSKEARELIEDVFQTKVMDWYGTSEPAILAFQTKNTYPFYKMPYGHCELHPDLSDAEGKREIVARANHNILSDFDYFKTGDIGIFESGRLRGIEGRESDFIEINARKIPLTNFLTLFYSIGEIREFQIVNEPSFIRFNYNGILTDAEKEDLHEKIQLRLNGNNFEINNTTEFMMSAGGKKPYFIKL